MSRPRLLDLFCGAGGAAMGYHRAGFDVVGVDIAPQPNYPFEFLQGDALAALRLLCDGLLDICRYDAIHASPPCQAYANVTAWRGKPTEHPDLIAPTRVRLEQTGLPWVIENVPEAPLRWDALCCGSHFGLRVKRHRAFEFSWARTLLPPSRCRHGSQTMPFMHKGEAAYRDAMGCGWMTAREAREAIPPAFTEFIGRELLAQLRRPALAPVGDPGTEGC